MDYFFKDFTKKVVFLCKKGDFLRTIIFFGGDNYLVFLRQLSSYGEADRLSVAK